MNTFDNVIEMFLSLVTDLSIIDYTQDELELELGIKVKVVISKARVIKDLSYDGGLSRGITDTEATILALGLVVEWLSPKLYNWELLETQVSSKDFTVYSNANRISEMRSLHNDSKNEFYNLITDYDLDGFLESVSQ